MTSIRSITLEVADTAAAHDFYKTAFGTDTLVDLRTSDSPTSGFRGFTLSLVVSQPGTVHSLVDAALAAGATALKPAARSFWGVGGVVRAPDGTIWKIATSARKDTGVPVDGSGSHRVVIGSDAGPFTDPDGFVWE